MNKYTKILFGLAIVFAISGCDIQRLLSLKEKCAESHKLMFCASTATQYSVFMNEQLLKLSDLSELGFTSDAIKGTPEDGTISYGIYRMKEDVRDKILAVKIQTIEGYVRRIDFPPGFATVVPPNLLYDYVEILGKSKIDIKTYRTVPQSSGVATEDQLEYYPREIVDKILGSPTAVKVIGMNRESAVYEFSVGKRKPVPMAVLVASRRAPSTVQEINLIFGAYRVRMTRSLIDVIALAKTFTGNAQP